MSVLVQIARSVPKSVDAVGVPVATSGAVARSLGLGRAALAAHGFEGKLGQVLVVPQPSGPAYIAIGVGAPGSLTPSSLRTAAAALVRAAGKRAVIATSLADLDDVASLQAGQVVVEGAMLAAYRFAAIVKEPVTRSLTELVLVVGDSRAKAVAAGAERGQVIAEAATLARDLANTPPSNLNARHIADMAVQISALTGLGVEVFNRDQLLAMGCGGVVGVNRGSVEPPRVVKLTYMPRNPSGHLAMVGKGITFDSGGLSIKTTDGMGTMKMDMSGAAAVLSAMSALKALKCKSRVTAYLMCTDNMPSGSAVKMGDVLTFRNGKTSEINNTDAEGRLVLADGLSLAVEDQPDAVVDIATLTGAQMVALGTKVAAVVGNDQTFIDDVRRASANTDEQVWQLPLEKAYRKQLDSMVADMKNSGGANAGAITASLFLSEFVGSTPWAHIDMAGPMNSDGDDGWLSRGATGFGTRLLIDLAVSFRR